MLKNIENSLIEVGANIISNKEDQESISIKFEFNFKQKLLKIIKMNSLYKIYLFEIGFENTILMDQIIGREPLSTIIIKSRILGEKAKNFIFLEKFSQILQFLNYFIGKNEANKLRRTCHYFRKLFQDQKLWKHLFQARKQTKIGFLKRFRPQ